MTAKICNNDNDNNNNVYFYRANSTLQFSNAPYNKRTVYYKNRHNNNIWSKLQENIMSSLQITIVYQKKSF